MTAEGGQQLPRIVPDAPTNAGQHLLAEATRVCAPIGQPPRAPEAPPSPAAGIVYAAGLGCNVTDVDGQRYVDFAAGFGALLLGHAHPSVLEAVSLQAPRLLQALGDLYPSDVKLELCAELARLWPGSRVLLGQSGADAVTAALKTAVLATGRPGVLALQGAYHGLGYAPLAACGLRASYREPFALQQGRHVRFIEPARDAASAERSLEEAAHHLAAGEIGAVLIEPVLGRGGCLVPPAGYLAELGRLAHHHGALLVTDEIWTGLGRSGAWLRGLEDGAEPDLIVLGKGLGGGLPISACLGRAEVMEAWRRDAEVTHTSTFAGAPLACAAALATLRVLEAERLPARARALGDAHRGVLRARLGARVREIRGVGLMTGIELEGGRGVAARLMQRLRERGWLTTTGGGQREVLVLTPPLIVHGHLLDAFDEALDTALEGLA